MGDGGGDGRGQDPFLDALEHLTEVLSAVQQDSRAVARRAAVIRRQRLRGRSYTDIVVSAEPPLMVERLRHQITALVEAAGRVQRAEARALHAEGMSMERIGSLFGLTRQRVSDLVRRSQRTSP